MTDRQTWPDRKRERMRERMKDRETERQRDRETILKNTDIYICS